MSTNPADVDKTYIEPLQFRVEHSRLLVTMSGAGAPDQFLILDQTRLCH